MDLVKKSVESNTSQKIHIRQLVVVLRTVLIGRSKNQDYGLKDCVIIATRF